MFAQPLSNNQNSRATGEALDAKGTIPGCHGRRAALLASAMWGLGPTERGAGPHCPHRSRREDPRLWASFPSIPGSCDYKLKVAVYLHIKGEKV